MCKWKYEVVFVAVILCVAGCVWWFISTNDERKADAQYERFVKFANRQKIEIILIRQTVELQQLKAAIQKVQRPPITPTPPMTLSPLDPNIGVK